MCCESKKGNLEEIAGFYNDWYASGYMDEWPADKKKRIFEIIRTLNFPETGDALDYGCGNGVFTGVLKQALPKWNVYGFDISSIAIDNARKRYSDCSFFSPSDMHLANKKFDLLFSHHVLEHVDDITGTWHEIDRYLNIQASTLHVLPCGNGGSFEHKVCMLKEDGINKDMGNKFYFEDTSHLRRLNTDQMNRFAVKYGFNLDVDYYSNQFYGAINWITQAGFSFILEMTSPKKAKDKIAKFKLICLRIFLLLIKFMRFPANTIDYKRDKMRGCKYYFLFSILLIFYPFSKLTNIFLEHMSNSEWNNKRSKKNGSEMYLYYKRTQTI
jgi:trans-aconitate methyltransferase